MKIVVDEINRDFDENGNYAASYAEWHALKLAYSRGVVNPLAIESWKTDEFVVRVVDYIKERIIRQYMIENGYKQEDLSENDMHIWYKESELIEQAK